MFRNKEKLTQIVRECVNSYDPERLIAMGCPADEYEPEIKEIADSMFHGMSREQCWILVCNVMSWHFGDHTEPVLYWRKRRELAEIIVSRLPEVDREP